MGFVRGVGSLLGHILLITFTVFILMLTIVSFVVQSIVRMIPSGLMPIIVGVGVILLLVFVLAVGAIIGFGVFKIVKRVLAKKETIYTIKTVKT